ncbi:MAG TPA: peptide chain release factor 3 [Candidatus Acidoferrales bacterium]|nr:peptide chain release factor 3 [Candidatus Acidoferrales bacterium]
MDESIKRLQSEVARRRTFAIISHPDAGKTTLTEKLLLYGGAVRLAGSVKQRRAERYATSDWMAIERERGISIATSVMQFPYHGYQLNLLDTPGHNDFSEDTYRTLAAADCAVMLIDSAKGVEPQTVKLFEVCRMRRLPIVTFINKMDRHGRDPLDLLDEIERVLGIPCTPANWPIGSGPEFQGVYDRWSQQLLMFDRSASNSQKAAMQLASLEDPELRNSIGSHAHEQLLESLALLHGAGTGFDLSQFRAGDVTPVYFGSALTNFGVEPFLDRFIELAPPPLARQSSVGLVPPDDANFSGFVFKIQANMDPQHADRVAFVRVCSGRFVRGMDVIHSRTGKELSLKRSLQFRAQERTLIEEAFAGDIIGIWDPGLLRIGDSLSENVNLEFAGIPRFSPEHFVRVILTEPFKRKQLKKGLDQLSEEGAVQVFFDRERLERDPILGAVGRLQFDVIQYRLKSEYSVDVRFEPLAFQHARWVEGELNADDLERLGGVLCLLDIEQRPLMLFKNDYWLRQIEERHKELKLVVAVQPGRRQRAAA